MLHSRLLKFILDIESVIYEIEQVCKRYENDFNKFNEDFIAKRAVERELEIIGEAVNNMSKIDPFLRITGTKHIISLII
ncbi:hypothetical protein BH23BAC1_BH23BAC1_16470 [soil metagenome]